MIQTPKQRYDYYLQAIAEMDLELAIAPADHELQKKRRALEVRRDYWLGVMNLIQSEMKETA